MHIPQPKDRIDDTARKPLCLPLEPGSAEAQHKYVSMTGFCGKERQDIKNLIALAGGLFTPHFSRSNSYLICKTKEGKKYEKAVQWNIPRCSAKWLEATVANWSVQPRLMRAYRIPDSIEPRISACTAASITFTITNVPPEKRGAIRAALLELGAREVPPIEATHLVAASIGQTEKFLTAISGCQHIVNEQWALASLDAGVFLVEEEFELIDDAGQRRYKMELEKVQERKRNVLGCRGLLAGKTFCISPSVVPPRLTIVQLILGAGGTVEPLRSKTSSKGGSITLISCSTDVEAEKYPKFKKAYRTDLIINGVLHQQLDYDSNYV